jgi:tetratricopeptide (TPR) repeat protein
LASGARALELRTQLARSLGLQKRFAEADAELDAIPVDDPAVATRVALERGRLRNSSGDAASAVPLFEAALAHARSAGHEFLEVDAAHMLGIADPVQSARWTAEALAVVDRTTDAGTRRWGIALHNNRGWALHDEGDFSAALAEFEAALAAAGDGGTADQLHIAKWAVARCLRSLGRVSEAREIQEQLLLDRPDDEYVVAELAELGAAGD